MLTRRAPTDEEQADLEFGYRIADAIAGLDIGQTIAVKSAAVVAVEAMEGTDAVIARAGQLAGAGVRDRQGRQAESGHALRRAGRRRRRRSRRWRPPAPRSLSVDAGKTLMIDGDAIVAAADAAGIAIVGRARRRRAGSTGVEVRRCSDLRVAVIGVGHLGQHHARILAALPGVELVAVVDTNRAARRGDRRRRTARGRFDRRRDLLGQRRRRHHRGADRAAPRQSRCRSSRAGMPVLVEKPMARIARRSRRA